MVGKRFNAGHSGLVDSQVRVDLCAPMGKPWARVAFTGGGSMSVPLEVEVIAYAPTAYYHCNHCEFAWNGIGVTHSAHREQLESSLPGDLLQQYQQLMQWIQELLRRYCDQVVIRVTDAASVQGVWKSLRYRARRYPAVIINGQVCSSGQEALTLASLEVEKRLSSLMGERR